MIYRRSLKTIIDTSLRTHPQAVAPTCFELSKFPFPALEGDQSNIMCDQNNRLISLSRGLFLISNGFSSKLKNIKVSSAKIQDLLGCELGLVSTQFFEPGHETGLQCLVQGVLGLVLVGVHVGFHRLAGGLKGAKG